MEILNKKIMVVETLKVSADVRYLVDGLFKIGAVKINVETPFTWKSHLRSPIYLDTRKILSEPKLKQRVIEMLYKLINADYKDKNDEVMIAGIEYAGTAYASSLADFHGKPVFYVRDKPKEHGLYNQIEGIDVEKLLSQKIILIEDVISIGGRAAEAVQVVRDQGGIVEHCYSVFDYNFTSAEKIFAGEASYSNKENLTLNKPCKKNSILSYKDLIAIGFELNQISLHDKGVLAQWYGDPGAWSETWISVHSKN